MNRRERRAASRAARTHQTSAAADIAQLMTEANSAYQRGRLAQVEVICKQVLSRTSTHATCLNLLGVIYQTSGRHRLATKLFAKAIAVDDLDAAFHYNIACSYQDLDEQIAAAKHFRTAIMLGMGYKRNVEEFVIENVATLQYIQLVAAEHWSVGNDVLLTGNDIAIIGKDIFLRCALELTPLHGVALELFLTTLRSSLLRLVADNQFDEAQFSHNVTHLFCALAQQCFINEYVFSQTDKETVQASELRDFYDENPYPRWTINPAKIVTGELKRQAPVIDSSARRGQNILIAGCGTGEHPFSIALYHPNARFLAIDISRTSLGYARRKMREEGLQNIEYAQADILKLGAVGRTFDIELRRLECCIISRTQKPDGACCSRYWRRMG